ncbi:hypothetical protein LTR27_011630 [Elasticomyces elasticus]|nr:hypothetical protein LTR27_011630 [Elasticomyces elasticus]
MSTTGDAEFHGSPLPTPTLHITSHNAASRAIIHSSEKPGATLYPEHRFSATTLYTTSTMPVDINNDTDIKRHQAVVAGGKLGVVQPNGTIVRFADFAPDSKGFSHRSQSLDYGVVLEGEVVLELDDGSTTHMSRGDIAIQRATMHAWHNPSKTEWARVLFVLQDCEPVMVNGKSLKEDLSEAPEALLSSGTD